MKIIIAGSNTNNAVSKAKSLGLYKLHSILNERKSIEDWDDDNHFLMVDSGAHSWNKKHDHVGMSSKMKLKPAEEFIEFYFNFIKKNKNRNFVWVEFDVYKDLPRDQIDDFYSRVMQLGIKGYFMRVYHEYLDPEPGCYDTLKLWILQGQKYIGIGADNYNNFNDIFHITKDKIKLHGFALTRREVIEKYPFYSVDSTSPLSTVIFGRYSRPILNYVGRDDIFKRKSIECFHNDDTRLMNAMIEVKQTQDYITQLWKEKGVIWKDIRN
jgi:hypothetical protein